MHLSYLQTIFLGLLQGITELFPVSSLGHAVLVPAWVGGSLGKFVSDNNDSYLSITVAMHLASAVALFLVFRTRWIILITSGVKSLRRKPISGNQSHASRVFLLVAIATVPAGLLGIAFQKKLTHLFGDAKYTAIFLTINGIVLITAERLTRKKSEHLVTNADEEIAKHVDIKTAVGVGFGQSAALLAGISRFGISMSAGLIRGLSHSVAADFAFLLSLPIIAAAAVVKLPHLAHLNDGLGPVLAGSLVSFCATYVSIKFLVKWFKTNTLYPFAIYCLVFGVISIIKFA